MTTVALLRHFPTDWNGERRLQGRTDRPLTAAARVQLAGLRLPPPWDGARLVASTLSRAAETARLLAGRDPETDPRLVEQGWGDWEGRLSADLLADPSTGFIPTHALTPDTRPPGGESGRDLAARLRPALADIAARGPAVIVTHKAVMRAILAEAHGCASADAPEIKRARLYPVRIGADGRVSDPGEPVRLIPREGS